VKIIEYGTVILTRKDIRVEGWLMEPEASDPAYATSEQVLLEVVIPWAQKRMNEAIMKNLIHNQAVAKAQNPTEN
jgi:hypothetical protein